VRLSIRQDQETCRREASAPHVGFEHTVTAVL
jgi:hypothetical protein